MTRSRTGNTTTRKIILELVLGQYLETRRSGHYVSIHLAPTEGWGALLALLDAFGPLFSSKKCKTKHALFSVNIGLNNTFGGKQLKL